MPKEQLFLFIVQTVVLANATNLASIPERAEHYRHVFSASGTFSVMDDAVYASGHIPDDMTASEAAHSFCSYMLDNLREMEEVAHEVRIEVPHWIVRS